MQITPALRLQATHVLETGLQDCLREKFLLDNGQRSGDAINKLHHAIHSAYLILMTSNPLAHRTSLLSEHTGERIALPYTDGQKNVDLALIETATSEFMDAIFVKAPTCNYSQNRKNYQESMAGTFFKCREAHRNLRVVFFDFLPTHDVYFEKNGNIRSVSELKLPAVLSTQGANPALYACARYTYHPSLLQTKNKEQWIMQYRLLASHGISGVQDIDVSQILDGLIHLVNDLETTLADVDLPSVSLDETMRKNIDGIRMAYRKQLVAKMYMCIGATLALMGGNGVREMAYLQTLCKEVWSDSKSPEFAMLWSQVQDIAMSEHIR